MHQPQPSEIFLPGRQLYAYLMPKRVKYRKTQRGSRTGGATRNTSIAFGEYAFQTLDRAWITNTQIELRVWR